MTRRYASTVPDLRSFRALTFDCYGTLIDWETGILNVLLPWAEREGRTSRDRQGADCGDARQVRSLTVAAPTDAGAPLLAERLLAEFAKAEPVREAQGPDGAPGFMLYPDVLRAVARDIAGALGARHSAPGAARRGMKEDAAEALANSVGEWPAFPDTPAALASLQKRCKLVIVSNIDRVSFARTNTRLGVEFDAVITAEDVRSYKPNLAHFHRAIEALAAMGIEPHEILHVAQSLDYDHVPAKALGLATCWVRRPRVASERGTGAIVEGAALVTPEAAGVRPDFTMDTLADLAALFGIVRA